MKLYQLEPIDSHEARQRYRDAGGEFTVFGDADILWTRLRRIDSTTLFNFPDCRYLCCPCTGLDHIDLAACERRGVKVLSLRWLPGLRSVRATVELTIGLILSLTRRIPWAFEGVKRGGWDRYGFMGTDLSGKRAGIVGYGRIGQGVAALLHHFGMEVAYHDPNVAGSMPLMQLLACADVVSVHAELTDSSVQMIGHEQFTLMKPGAFFVNTARGGLVNTDALLFALRTGRLAGAALDVANGEPVVPAILRAEAADMPNLLLTPHIGGCTREAIEATEGMVMDALLKELAHA